MGLFSRLFKTGSDRGSVHSGKNSRWAFANRFNKARGGHAGGWGAIAFGNIVTAHSSAEDIVEEFGLNKDNNSYGCDAYLIAYQETWDEANVIYEQYMQYYTELIEGAIMEIHDLESEIAECQADVKDLEEEIEDLQEEIENLQEELEDLLGDGFDPDDLFEAADIREEIAECRERIEECREEIEELQAEIDEMREDIGRLNDDIDGWHAEMESFSVEELMNMDDLEKRAMEYACEFAQAWINGEVWIPIEVLNWAYYDVSDHNR